MILVFFYVLPLKCFLKSSPGLSWQETLSLIQIYLSIVEKFLANSGITHFYEIFMDGSGLFNGYSSQVSRWKKISIEFKV